jgi:hypothetical protein
MTERKVGRLYALKGPVFRLRFPHERGRGRPKQIVIDYSYVRPRIDQRRDEFFYPAVVSNEVSTYRTIEGPRIVNALPVPFKTFNNCRNEINLFFDVWAYELARSDLEHHKEAGVVTNIEDRARLWRVIGATKAMWFPPRIFGETRNDYSYARDVEKFFKENAFVKHNMQRYMAWKKAGIL